MTRKVRVPSAPRFRSEQQVRLAAMDAVLEGIYGAPARVLDNKRNPLDEAVYIVLSLQTDIPRLKQSWRSLRRAFPTWHRARDASVNTIASAIKIGGLHNQKARALKNLLSTVSERFGALSLDSLRALSTEAAERELTRLPGLSWKSARCVLMYSLDREVFPVDTNTFRIMKRAGILSQKAVYRRRGLHDALQAAVPPHRRKALHMNLVIHGRDVCTPLRPRCSTCTASQVCPRIGVELEKVPNAD